MMLAIFGLEREQQHVLEPVFEYVQDDYDG